MSDVVVHVLKDKRLTFKVDVLLFAVLVGLHMSKSPLLSQPLVRVLSVLLLCQQLYTNFLQESVPSTNPEANLEEDTEGWQNVQHHPLDNVVGSELTPDDISNKWFVNSALSSRIGGVAPHVSKVDFWNSLVGTPSKGNKTPLCTRSYSSYTPFS